MPTAMVIGAMLLLLAGPLGAAEPILWSAAGDHAGETVTVEGDVAAASSTPDQVVLEFAPADPAAFRVVLIVPIMTDLPRFPERLYQGKRVRASGVVRRFRGRPEMVLRSPGQLEVVDVAGPASAPAPPTPPAPRAVPSAPPPAPPAAAVVPTPAPVAPMIPPPVAVAPIVAAPAPAPASPPPVRAEAPPVALPATTSTTQPPPASPIEALAELRCTRARQRWQEAGRRASELAAALQRCIAGTSYHCRQDAAAMAPALSELEWAEQQVADACP